MRKRFAFAVALAACSGSTFHDDTAPSGDLKLLPLRTPVRIYAGQNAAVKVLVLRHGQDEHDTGPVPDTAVAFRLLGAAHDGVTLIANGAQSGMDGVAGTTLATADTAATSTTTPTTYQVEASIDGAEPVAVSVQVIRAPRTLRKVTADPIETFTYARLPLVVEAVSEHDRPLIGESITFTIMQGGAGAALADPAGGGGSDAVTVTTEPSGRAEVRLTTGTAAAPSMIVRAQMQGTAPVEFQIHVREAGPCATARDCPRGMSCGMDHICSPADVMPAGPPCDPIDGVGCDGGRVCIGGRCELPPGACSHNSDCPNGYACESGMCQPYRPGGGGMCRAAADCPPGDVCVGGLCTPPAGCRTDADCPGAICIAGSCTPRSMCSTVAGRLAGTWNMTSVLHLRDALSPAVAGILDAAGVLGGILGGTFSIPGVPSFVTDLVSSFVSGLIPPWARSLITVLSTLDRLLSDMTVASTVSLASAGGGEYVASETWDFITFEGDSGPITATPDEVPGLDGVTVDDYGAREICGTYFADRHDVHARIGELVRYFIDAAVSAATCSVDGVPCASGLDDAIDQAIDCSAIASAIQDGVSDIVSGDISGAVESACMAAKADVIARIDMAIAGISADVITLQGLGTVSSATSLTAGVWTGTLVGSDFPGEFHAGKL